MSARFLIPTRRWTLGGWEIKATRAFPPCWWRPYFRRPISPLVDGWDLRWLTVYVTCRRRR